MKKLIILLIPLAVITGQDVFARDKAIQRSSESFTDSTAKGSDCTVNSKNYKRKAYHPKISGKWKAMEAWVHDADLLGKRNFYFTFLPGDSILIDEPESNWHVKGTWMIGAKENTIQWKMPDAANSFDGKYDIVNGQLILSGKGFVGAQEYICLKLKKQ